MAKKQTKLIDDKKENTSDKIPTIKEVFEYYGIPELYESREIRMFRMVFAGESYAPSKKYPYVRTSIQIPDDISNRSLGIAIDNWMYIVIAIPFKKVAEIYDTKEEFKVIADKIREVHWRAFEK